jgi:hypothetical protein
MGKNVALAVIVVNPFAPSSVSQRVGTINQDTIRTMINQFLEAHPQERAKAAAIEEIVIVSNEDISEANYSDDITDCYIRHMETNDWARPNSVGIISSSANWFTVYIAYGTE